MGRAKIKKGGTLTKFKKVTAILFACILLLNFTGCSTASQPAPPANVKESQKAPAVAAVPAVPVAQAATQIDPKELLPTSGNLKVHYIDVGQADSIFIELPNKQTMLIDAGNGPDGPNIVKYIKSLNYTDIDYLVATHPHEDHIGGMSDVVNSLNIKAVYMPKASATTKTFEHLLIALQNKKLKIDVAKAGVNILNLENLKINIIAPVGDKYDDLNNYSAVIKITYGQNSFLFMGDAENISENQITADVSADVLKVGHHGSNSSTQINFLKKVSPKHTIISVGKGNDYGHPADVTLKNLSDLGINIYRTDVAGPITVISDGTKIIVDKPAFSYKPQAPPAVIAPPTVSTPPIISTPSKQETSKDITVYITKTGAKYHRDGCRYLSKSQIAISLSKAILSYDPCSVCDPPQ